jgi:hypothetical protein
MIVDERRGSLARSSQTSNRFDPHLHTMPDLRRLAADWPPEPVHVDRWRYHQHQLACPSTGNFATVNSQGRLP